MYLVHLTKHLLVPYETHVKKFLETPYMHVKLEVIP